MIELHGLTEHQVELLDIIWNIDSMPEVEEWVATLSDSDQMECHSLIELLAIEILDSQLKFSVKFPEAEQVIERIRFYDK
jgi:hypothetical protein